MAARVLDCLARRRIRRLGTVRVGGRALSPLSPPCRTCRFRSGATGDTTRTSGATATTATGCRWEATTTRSGGRRCDSQRPRSRPPPRCRARRCACSTTDGVWLRSRRFVHARDGRTSWKARPILERRLVPRARGRPRERRRSETELGEADLARWVCARHHGVSCAGVDRRDEPTQRGCDCSSCPTTTRTSASSGPAFVSSNAADPARRPVLAVTFTMPG